VSTKGRVRAALPARKRPGPVSEAVEVLALDTIFREVSEGLRASPKRLPEKLLYDNRGARLFDRISALDAYYPTRTEIAILKARGTEIRALVGPRASVIELGAGSGVKTHVLLGSLDSPAACVLIDIA
jgi:uncharacterized SAM-dependent methyltransferase